MTESVCSSACLLALSCSRNPVQGRATLCGLTADAFRRLASARNEDSDISLRCARGCTLSGGTEQSTPVISERVQPVFG